MRNPSPLRGGSAERSGGRGGGSHSEGLLCGYPHPTGLRPATLPARGRDKKRSPARFICGFIFLHMAGHLAVAPRPCPLRRSRLLLMQPRAPLVPITSRSLQPACSSAPAAPAAALAVLPLVFAGLAVWFRIRVGD